MQAVLPNVQPKARPALPRSPPPPSLVARCQQAVPWGRFRLLCDRVRNLTFCSDYLQGIEKGGAPGSRRPLPGCSLPSSSRGVRWSLVCPQPGAPRWCQCRARLAWWPIRDAPCRQSWWLLSVPMHRCVSISFPWDTRIQIPVPKHLAGGLIQRGPLGIKPMYVG